jgi:putative ABC transport system permease protein
MMDTFLKDIRYGIRGLLKRPGFTAVVVLTLALGIGANTTIFSVVNAVLLRPLPFREPARLIRIWESNPKQGWPDFTASAPNFKDWQSQQTAFEGLSAMEMSTFNLGDGEPERIAAASVSANFFPMLGVTPVLGRSFVPEEERVGHDRVVVLSHALWQRRFGGDQTLVGKTIRLNAESYNVVGILPAEFQFVGTRELWTPLVLDPAREPWRADRSNHNLLVFGRLKAGVTLPQAESDLGAVATRLEQQYPLNAGWGVRLRTFNDWIVPQEIRRSMFMLLAAVAFVLLIACANVANLLLVLAGARQREMAIRIALGGSRARLSRLLLTESLLLAGLGGVAGVLLALWSVALVAKSTTLNIPRLNEARVDAAVLGYTLVVSLLTGIIFGLAPAWRAAKLNLTSTLKEGGRSTDERRQRLRSALVTSEIALALVLLVGAGLLMRSFIRLQNVPVGFTSANVATMQINLPASKYGPGAPRINFYDQLRARLRAVPGVTDAAAITQPPLTSGNWAMEVNPEGRAATASNAPLSADARAISPGYFHTMGIPLLKGRDFTEHDQGESPLTLIVSEKFAERYWPNEDPIGKRFRPGTSNPFGEVIGVVGNVRNLSLEEEGRPAFYFSYGHIAMPGLTVVVRMAAGTTLPANALRAQVTALDPELPVFNQRTMDQIVANAVGQQRFQTVLLSIFSGVSLLLAAVGIYGLMSFLVKQRTHEIGIRMALGASRSNVLHLVIKRGMTLALLGIAVGVAGALALTRLLKSLLFGVTPTDLTTFGIVCAGLLLVALLACYIPARRATKVDPLVALRYE